MALEVSPKKHQHGHGGFPMAMEVSPIFHRAGRGEFIPPERRRGAAASPPGVDLREALGGAGDPGDPTAELPGRWKGLLGTEKVWKGWVDPRKRVVLAWKTWWFWDQWWFLQWESSLWRMALEVLLSRECIWAWRQTWLNWLVKGR